MMIYTEHCFELLATVSLSYVDLYSAVFGLLRGKFDEFKLSESDVASITAAGRAKPPVRCFWQDSLGTPLS